MDHEKKNLLVANHSTSNPPPAVGVASTSTEELVADADEPPDPLPQSIAGMSAAQILSQNSLKLEKPNPMFSDRKRSLLTEALQTSDSDSEDSAEGTRITRGHSSASVWSNNSIASTAELTSDGGLTSPGTRACSPSPPLPPAPFSGLPPIFSKPNFDQPLRIRHDDDSIAPLQRPQPPVPSESVVEAGLGRKRCITFACGGKSESKKVGSPPKQSSTENNPMLKRPCSIKFVCPNKTSLDGPPSRVKPRISRQPSPAPKFLRVQDSPKGSIRSHRDSDSTVRNASPQQTRKQPVSARPRNNSEDSDIGRSEATRFHAFASSEEEVEEWVQESTCHRSRLTINDTLKIENKLRRLGEEVEEEEALEEEEDDEAGLDEEDQSDDIEQDSDDEHGNLEELRRSWSLEDDSDDGFQTDDEGGFAGSDDDEDSDGQSDYAWWTYDKSSSGQSKYPDHIRPSGQRSISESSLDSADSQSERIRSGFLARRPRARKPKPIAIPSAPDLPDSTDFVCGTLDEDRPAEAAYMSALEARRAAKHRPTPQDIDPTFPTSDTELETDEEDEADEVEKTVDESDQHFFVAGSMEAFNEGLRGRSNPKTRDSPALSALRFRSPPPPLRRTGQHRSPPPRKLFGRSPRRLKSPAPAPRLRSPPPTRRTSFARSPKPSNIIHFAGLAERPQLTIATSLPRTPLHTTPHFSEDDEETSKENPSRGAIAIKAGLEQKRIRRREKLYQKLCRKNVTSKEKKPQQPGKGCALMRKHYLKANGLQEAQTKDAMILSI